MKVAVWDTYITKKDGNIMHFDIIVPENIKDEKTIYSFGKDYLLSIDEEGRSLTARECNLCHIESAADEMVTAIEEKGYYIIELEGCR